MTEHLSFARINKFQELCLQSEFHGKLVYAALSRRSSRELYKKKKKKKTCKIIYLINKLTWFINLLNGYFYWFLDSIMVSNPAIISYASLLSGFKHNLQTSLSLYSCRQYYWRRKKLERIKCWQYCWKPIINWDSPICRASPLSI